MARARSMPLPILLYWRLERGYTQEQLADRISMRRNTVWRIEAGYPARVRTARLLAKALGITVAALSSSPAELNVHRDRT
jgi:transcriptional regulator with XRE-family HTH domain